MAPNTLGIDHPLVTVRDLAQAYRVYQRLGFNPAPQGRHPWGTANHLILFERGFLELIGVYDASRLGQGSAADGAVFGAFIRDYLARREDGVSLVALHSNDAYADHAAVAARGLQSSGLVEFRRAVTLPDGTPDEAIVTLSVLINPTHPNTSTFICQQHRPQVVWVPAWQHHPNRVDGIRSVIYMAAEPAVLRDYYRALFGPEHVTEQPEMLLIDTPNGTIQVINPSLARQRYPESAAALPAPGEWPCAIAIRLHSCDPAAVVAILQANTIPFVQDNTILRLAPAQACGVILEFIND